MGLNHSKEDLSHIVSIYGYHPLDFSWQYPKHAVNQYTVDQHTVNQYTVDQHTVDQHSEVYHTTGVIININSKKYVITTRSGLIRCRDIFMYSSSKSDHILETKMYVSFQMIEFNMMILANVDDKIGINVAMNVDPKSHIPYVMPHKKGEYSVVTAGIESNNYKREYIKTKFVKNNICAILYLPETFMYKFTIKSNSNNKISNRILGICGAPIITKNCELIGIVHCVDPKNSKNLYVSPLRLVLKTIQEFIYGNQLYYRGLQWLPYAYEVSKDIVKIIQNLELNDDENDFGILKKNDILRYVNDKDIVVIKSEAFIYDDEYKLHIPLPIYIQLVLQYNQPLNLMITRNKSDTIVQIKGSYFDNSEFPYTSQSYYYPTELIPYLCISGIIIVRASHELFHICNISGIEITNIQQIVNANTFIILDCLNDEIAKVYHLPQIITKKISCPIIVSIDNNTLTSLDYSVNNVKSLKIINGKEGDDNVLLSI